MNPRDYPVGTEKHLHALEIYREILDEDFNEETIEEIKAIIRHEEWLLESYNHKQLGFEYENR